MNTRMKINLDTESDVTKLVILASRLPEDIKVVINDAEGMRVNARSVIGVLYAMTFTELWLESNANVYLIFKEFAAD